MLSSILILTLAVLAPLLINIYAIHKSRGGRTRMHSFAFISGIAGLCGLPLAVIAALPFSLQLLTPAYDSPEAITFFSIAMIWLLSTLFSAISGMVLQAQTKKNPAAV